MLTLKEFEQNFAHVDLLTVARVAKEGIYVISPNSWGRCYGYGPEEIRVNFYDECFDIINLTKKPDEDENAWYKLSLPFSDLGITYFFTKEEAEAKTKELRDKKEKVKLDESWCW